MIIRKLNKYLLSLVIGIVSLTLFAGMANAGDYGCYGSSYSISDGLKSWSQKIAAKQRFVVLKQFNCEAVLDKETQLVWEKSPSTDTMTWNDAVTYCYNLNLGGRGGFRLPTVEELRTLVDPNQTDPALPTGHPFVNVQSTYYWSATTDASGTANALNVTFFYGTVLGYDKAFFSRNVWCVRGGHGYDAY